MKAKKRIRMKYILSEKAMNSRFLQFSNLAILRKIFKSSLPIFLLLLAFNICSAQMIEIEHGAGGYKYFQNGEKQSLKDLTKIMESDSLEYANITRARSWHTLSALTAGAGSILVIISIIKGTNESFAYAAVGVGMIAFVIPFSIIGNRRTRSAVDLYNLKYKSFGMTESKSFFTLGATANGLGINYIF